MTIEFVFFYINLVNLGFRNIVRVYHTAECISIGGINALTLRLPIVPHTPCILAHRTVCRYDRVCTRCTYAGKSGGAKLNHHQNNIS